MHPSDQPTPSRDLPWMFCQRLCGSISLATIGWTVVMAIGGSAISPPDWATGKLLSVLIAGSVGYGTNYLAVKMLFRPLKPVKWPPLRWIWRQGLIPARQGELAVEVGKQVAHRLLRSEDLAVQVSGALNRSLQAPDAHTRAVFTPLLDAAVPVLRTHLEAGEAIDREALARAMRSGLQDNADKVMELLNRVVRRQSRGSGLKTWASESLIDWKEMEKTFIKQLDKPKGIKWSRGFIDALTRQDIDWSQVMMGDPGKMSDQAHDALIASVSEWIDGGHLSALLKDLDVQGQVTEAARALDVAELEQMANQVANQHFGAIQVLGFVFGLMAGGLMVAVT